MQKIVAESPTTKEGKQYHIACGPEDVASAVLLPGDPGRVATIAGVWDSAKEVAYHREFHTMTGIYQDTPITCTSTGIGSPAMAIAVEELSRIGAETFIRVGTCGGIQPGQKLGDLVISQGAVRLDGASRDYVMPEYPAVGNPYVLLALIEACESLGFRYHVGITASTDTFYCGQGRPGFQEYFPSHKEKLLQDLQRARVQNFEMETSCLFTLASLFGKHAGSICVIIANRVTNEFEITEEFQKRAGLAATEAVRILHHKEPGNRIARAQIRIP